MKRRDADECIVCSRRPTFRTCAYDSSMRWLLVHGIVLYQFTLGRLLGGNCRFTPSCSQYAIDAINKFGPLRGSWKAVKRIARCHPWGGRGYDPA